MKKIKFTCSNCRAKLRVPTHLAGISAPCPKCGRKITAPTDLDSIVDDEPATRSKTLPNRQENDASPKVAPSATAVADAPPRTDPAPRVSSAASVPSSAPAVVSASKPSTIQVPTATVTPTAPSAPAPPETPAPAPEPVQEEQEPIIEETLFTPPAPPQVAVAETPVPQSPLEKTQPIHISPLPGTLPDVKNEIAGPEPGGGLPRLDADRGGNFEGSSLDALISPAPGSGTPTRLHLPGPGDLNGQQSPGDFIVPGAALPVEPVPPQTPVVEQPPMQFPEEPLYQEEPTFAPSPEPVIPDISDLDMSAPGILMDELGEPALQEPLEELFLDQQEPAPPAEFNSSAESAPPVETEAPLPVGYEPALPESFPPAEPEADMIHPGQEETPRDELSSGSMERLFSEQGQAGPTAPVQPAVGRQSAAPVDELDAMFESTSAAIPAPNRANSQSLEEMFGELPSEGGKKKKLTNIVMLSMIGAVAIIAIIVVVVGINAAGGLSPQIASNQTEITPPPKISEVPPANSTEPSIVDAPAVIDPVAQERVNENTEGITRSTTTLPGDTSQPVLIADDTPPSSIETPAPQSPAPVEDAPALSFDERVQQIVNGSNGAGGSESQMNIIGGEPKPGPLDSLDATIADLGNTANTMVDDFVGAAGGAADAAAAGALVPGASSAMASNYNPPSAFPAPGPDEAPLGKTHDLLDAFLRAPDWQSRIPYTYQGESLRPTIEEYYKKWPVTSFERFSLQLFQMEQDTSLGGPYWVYLVSTNDLDQGYPVIVRVEDGNLKVDWDIYSEFQDQHFVGFQKGAIASPHTFRLVIERVSDYFGSDRDQFTNLDDYLVYQINPPYGDLSEHSEYAFVKKGSELASELESVVGLNDEPLAVIVTIEQKAFDHGVKHLEITDYVTEGWFR